MRQKYYLLIFICAVIGLASPTLSHGQPGTLDTTYGLNGIVFTQPAGGTNLILAIALQPDGKVIAVGEGGGTMHVFRYNVNGSLDTSFNGTGRAEITSGTGSAVAIQPDGKIVVVGDNGPTANIDIKVVRYNANGTFDTTFDGDGIVTTAIGGGTDLGNAVVIQPDGKIIVSGRSDTPPNFQTSYAVVRYNPDGSVDTSFGNQGFIIPSMSGVSFARHMALQPDGKIVLVRNRIVGGVQKLVVLRYNSLGLADSTFGVNGFVELSVGVGFEFEAVELQTDGKIVVSCSGFTNATSYDFWVLRFHPDGAADDSFGTGGAVKTPIGPGGSLDQAKALAIQANGKIVVAGRAPNVPNSDFVVVRYNRNGTLDTKWGNGGIVISELGGNADAINAVAIQKNGRIVVAGESDKLSPGTRHFALARYKGDTAENFDYDRDGDADVSVFRPSTADWYVLGSSGSSVMGFHWGISTDELASADYDGDLKVDIAVWRPGSPGRLYILNSSDNSVTISEFGEAGDDVSVIGDYDGDGRADPAVYRAGASPGQQSFFYYRGSSNNPSGSISYVPWGSNGDVAARGDYNGDGRLDPTVFRPANGTWHSLNLPDSTSTVTNWGLGTDKLVQADYTGDGKTDRAVFRNGVWYILRSDTGIADHLSWGLSTDKLVPSDYDGDGRADVAIYRDGVWYIQQSSGGVRHVTFGLSSDIPMPVSYLP